MDLNNILEKYYNMSQIQSGRKDKSDEKMVDKGKDNDLIEDLKFNINRANEIVRLYENQKRYYLNLNVALITITSITYGVIYNYLNILGIISLICSLTLIFAISIGNFYYSSKSNETGDTKPTLCFYRDNDNPTLERLNKELILGDLKTQIMNLYKYQENYHNIAVSTRKNTLKVIISLLISFPASSIINLIAAFFIP